MSTQEQKEIWKEDLEKCRTFFDAVAKELEDIYVVVPSRSKKWPSACLVPIGAENQVTYYGKPVNSLRIGPNWNWRAGYDRCSNPTYIQCVTPDLPYARKRDKEHPELATPPVFGNMVGYFDTDNKYHCIYGEKYEFKGKKWVWVDNTPEAVAKMIREKKEYLDKTMNTKI